MKIRFSGGFHGEHMGPVTVRIDPHIVEYAKEAVEMHDKYALLRMLTEWQHNKVWRALCGIHGCECGGAQFASTKWEVV